MESTVTVLWGLVGLYALSGMAVAGYIHVRGLHVVDPATRGAGWMFRLLITPGLVVLWPLMVRAVLRARAEISVSGEPDEAMTPRTLRRLHGLFAVLLAILLPIAVGAAILARPDPAPVQTLPIPERMP